MFWKKKKTESTLEKVISELADYLLDNGLNDDFRRLAFDKYRELALSNFSELQIILQNPPKASINYSSEKHGLGGWLSACQFSIFEIIYNSGKDALPFIRKIAWGEYDWIQGNAIELLIRLASQGIKRDEIVLEIKQNFPEIRYEAQLYTIQPLLPRLESDEKLRSIFDELMSIEEFKESYDELTKCNA